MPAGCISSLQQLSIEKQKVVWHFYIMCNTNHFPSLYYLLIVGRINKDNLWKAATVAERDQLNSAWSNGEEIKDILFPFLRNGKEKVIFTKLLKLIGLFAF